MLDSPHGHARTSPLLDPRPGEDDPERHAGRITVALRPAALAHRATPGRSPQPGVARSAIRRHAAVRHGPERKGRPVSRGAGPPRACGRLSLGPAPEPCGQGVHRTRWQATIPKERGPLDCRGDCESGIAGGRHRNRRQGPCLPQPAPQLRPPLATATNAWAASSAWTRRTGGVWRLNR